ncbi:transposase [Photobacterium leiognathi]|uniref:zinc ribbon domain-containing protein n=1 Tax=Photobacterium leiognathi TaxID=553611 RepID=UPI003BF4F81C|nr:transposase [Photobacterium leiognathi]
MPHSHLVRLLRLGSVKQWFRQQANNKGIRVHFVNPAWTSNQCYKCGFIHR